ncbi:hypothetical protein TNCV_3981751 [Trichonephila clavipes]|nr:hypothetical protein TNCV_3981751 [Trichonephila clavipes]
MLPDEDAELGTVRVSQQPVELPHAPPVQAFTVRLVETAKPKFQGKALGTAAAGPRYNEIVPMAIFEFF